MSAEFPGDSPAHQPRFQSGGSTSECEHFDCIVVGAGIQGLSTLYELAKRGKRVLLLERFELFHRRASSHGPTRIFRCAYANPAYVELARQAHLHAWPALEKAAGENLLEASRCCLFGPRQGLIKAYAQAVASSDCGVRPLADTSAAQQAFPEFHWPSHFAGLVDSSGAVIAADKTLRALARLASASGALIRENQELKKVESCSSQHPHGDGLFVQTNRGHYHCDRIVICAGPFTTPLIQRFAPKLTCQLTPVRQTVAYFRIQSVNALPPPTWVYLGERPNEVFYSLPTDDSGVFKVARHVTRSNKETGDSKLHDPEQHLTEPDPESIADIRRTCERLLTAKVGELVEWDHCFYSNTLDEGFLLGPTPREPRVIVGAGFSGHGFKFGPLIGQILADFAEHGDCHREIYRALSADLAS